MTNEQLGKEIREFIANGNYAVEDIGTKVLELLGYTVNIGGFGYNSLLIEVKNKEGKVIYRYTIGD